MDKTFDTAEEARAIMYDINTQLSHLPYNSDLSKFATNISNMVSDLSRLEVYTRRTHPRSRYHRDYKALRETISAAIKQLENLILIARLVS